ncbi:hypothetical protein SCLCIDRAFT_700934 [Scleroderma citrinum Foug A]|uniref:Uncharacterized protein n=1 Tax=Scleroderma citrinum Foug A TaxID=1036808 RepID=A0A0C3ENG6_9AGAM|nr:hypothetical protein SCLCIDRAFT_700934 [Scleroderma citrinum Foug A]
MLNILLLKPEVILPTLVSSIRASKRRGPTLFEGSLHAVTLKQGGPAGSCSTLQRHQYSGPHKPSVSTRTHTYKAHIRTVVEVQLDYYHWITPPLRDPSVIASICLFSQLPELTLFLGEAHVRIASSCAAASMYRDRPQGIYDLRQLFTWSPPRCPTSPQEYTYGGVSVI